MKNQINANPDWENIKKRWEAWWDHGIYDRVIMQVYAPENERTDSSPEIEEGEKEPVTKWADAAHIIKRSMNHIKNTFHGAEAIPTINPGWSVGHACILGCTPHFAPDTVWVDPLPVKENGFPDISFNRQNPWLNWIMEFMQKAARESAGGYYVIPSFGNGPSDTLALIRDGQNLLIDMMEDSDWVKQALSQITNILSGCYDNMWEKLSNNGMDGYINWCNVWSPRKSIQVDSDIGCMLSPGQYKEFVLPGIAKLMDTVSYRIYHLDGAMAAKNNLDILLDVDELQAIQWVPGAGREEIMQWVPLIQKIQEKKKSLIVYVRPDEVMPLLKEVRPEGLCISVYCSSKSEAEAMIEKAGRMF